MMIHKSIKEIITLLIVCIGATGHATAQDNYAVTIQQQFDQYQKKALQEKVYVHTDKSFYLAGEIVWFKVYYVDGTFHKPLHFSKVAYVEITDRENKPVMQAKIALKKGSGSGSFYLPVSVNTGNYTLRAYTNWMKNFGADYYFEKTVNIVNSLKPLPTPPRDTTPGVQIQFFPEGGNLVRGIESKVAFQATDKYGRGQDFYGVVLNENNDTLLRFRPLKFGIGHFSLLPSGQHTYKAIVTTPGGHTISRNLPAVYEQGYAMQIREGNANTIQVTVTTNFSSPGQDVFLLAHTRQSMKVAQKHVFINGTATFVIDKDKLGEGISQLTVFNNQKQPVCERLYFKLPEHMLEITANSDARQYGCRNKVNVLINSKTGAHKQTASNMSLAVYRLDSLQAFDQQDILSYLWLSSDLKGYIESPAYYFSGQSDLIKEATDNLMLVHGWRKFNWENIVTGTTPAFYYAPEYDGHIIAGKVVNTATEKPTPGIKTYLSVPGVQLQFYNARSNTEGQIWFDVRDYYGQNEIILQTDAQGDSNTYRVDIVSPFSEKYSTVLPTPFVLPAATPQTLTNHSIDMQVQNSYAGEKLSRFNVPQIDTMAFYGKPFKTFMLDDYVRFSTIEEVLREYVPDVAIRRYDGQLHLKVFDWDIEQYYSSDPLILLDGVPVSNLKILAYDPLKVKKLEVVTKKYVTGQFMYDGIVSFTTYHGDRENLQLDAKAVILDYDGMQLKREFYSPAYENEQQANSRLPDFRNLLYWSSDIQTDNQGNTGVNFYTSDVPGEYIAVVQGMDGHGNSGSYYFTFRVKGK
jgi:hypothetical protein